MQQVFSKYDMLFVAVFVQTLSCAEREVPRLRFAELEVHLVLLRVILFWQ